MKGLVSNVCLGVAVVAALLNIGWIILLKDYSYAGLSAPIAAIGAAALIVSGILNWRRWLPLLALPFSIPFLPWVDWMYG